MPSKTSDAKSPRMSDEAVKAKTGKTWKEWFAVLDKAGAKKMTHPEIARYLNSEQGLPPWWQQMVTVTTNRRAAGEKHQRPDGFEINISRTIKAPLAKLFKSVANEQARLTWLPEDGLAIRKSDSNKSVSFYQTQR